mgnify:CR=1 FL=1
MTDTVKTRENVFKIKRIIEKENKLIDLTEEYKSNDEKKQELKEAPPTNKEKALAYFSGKPVDSNTSKSYNMPVGFYISDIVEGSGADKSELDIGNNSVNPWTIPKIIDWYICIVPPL